MVPRQQHAWMEGDGRGRDASWGARHLKGGRTGGGAQRGPQMENFMAEETGRITSPGRKEPQDEHGALGPPLALARGEGRGGARWLVGEG